MAEILGTRPTIEAAHAPRPVHRPSTVPVETLAVSPQAIQDTAEEFRGRGREIGHGGQLCGAPAGLGDQRGRRLGDPGRCVRRGRGSAGAGAGRPDAGGAGTCGTRTGSTGEADSGWPDRASGTRGADSGAGGGITGWGADSGAGGGAAVGGSGITGWGAVATTSGEGGGSDSVPPVPNQWASGPGGGAGASAGHGTHRPASIRAPTSSIASYRARPQCQARSWADQAPSIVQATAHCWRLRTAAGLLRSCSWTGVVRLRPCRAMCPARRPARPARPRIRGWNRRPPSAPPAR